MSSSRPYPPDSRPTPSARARLRGEQVPDAIADDHAVADVDPDQLGGGQEEVGVRLGVADLVAGDERRVRRQAEELDPPARVPLGAAGRDRPRDAEIGERREQLARARQRPDAVVVTKEGFAVEPWERRPASRGRVACRVSRTSALTNSPPLIPIRRWIFHTARLIPTSLSDSRHAITCW